MRLLVRQGGFKGTHCQGTATYQDQASSRLPSGWRVESAEDGVNVYSNGHEVDSSFFVPKRATGTAKPKSSGPDRPRHEPKSSQPPPAVSKIKPSKPKTAKNENLPAKAAADKPRPKVENSYLPSDPVKRGELHKDISALKHRMSLVEGRGKDGIHWKDFTDILRWDDDNRSDSAFRYGTLGYVTGHGLRDLQYNVDLQSDLGVKRLVESSDAQDIKKGYYYAKSLGFPEPR